MTTRRQISLLPVVHQTDALKRFFNSTVDQLFEPGETTPVFGYIGRKPSYYNPATDFYKAEPTAARQKYQLEPMMVSVDPNNAIQAKLFYEDLISNLNQVGALTSDPNRLFGAGYYSWAPPIDIDRIMNFPQYYWSGSQTTSLLLTVPGVEVGTMYLGDGATTDFALPPVLASRATSEEDITVMIGGVVITTGFTITSSVVSFTTAPTIDKSIIIFRYGNIGNGTNDTFIIPADCPATAGLDTVYAFVDGVETTAFTINDNGTVTLVTPPPVNSHVMITRLKDLQARIEGHPTFDPTGLTLYPITALIEGMKVKLVDPVNFALGFDLKAYGHPWDESGYSTFYVENVDISIILVPIGEIDLSGDGYAADDPTYVVIARADQTRSYWSRINRWVHRDALINASDATVDNQAKRPIIEFLENIQQFNYGTYRIQNTSGSISSNPIYNSSPIDFTTINGLPEGQVFIDNNYSPAQGDVIFVNLPQSPHNNRLYFVDTTAADNDPTIQVYVLQPLDILTAGAITQIKETEYWFDGAQWNTVGAPADAPLFSLYDHNGTSLSDVGVYPSSTFVGSRIFSFADGTGLVDPLIGKALSYDTFGQIIFENELETRSYTYRDGDIIGYYFYQRAGDFENAWHKADANLIQAIDANNVSDIPLNLQANPDFDTPTFLSRNDYFAHFTSILENQIGFEGRSFASNNWYTTAKDVTKGLVIIQHEAPLLKLMALMQNDEISLTSAIEYVDREYSRFKAKFLKAVIDLSLQQDTSLLPQDTLAVSALNKLNAGKTQVFPFHDSMVGGGNFFIPLTPALLGIAPLVEPEVFVDDTFGTPVTFTRGHDGSCTALFGDVRDTALLALETRIYTYATAVTEEKMRLDELVSGKFRTCLYSQAELTTIMMPMFEKWARDNGVNFENTTYDGNDPFTWNYRSCTDRYGNDCRGHWRGIYQDYFDTDKPHIAPWEMLGFAQKPLWWESNYGPAPYTRSNTILWNDIAAGIIKDGDRAGTYASYTRTDLMQILPIDMNGNLLDPIASTLILRAPPVQFARSGWQFGDRSNIEAIWSYTSSYYFSLAMAKFLMRPPFFVETFWDVLNETIIFDQTVQTPQMKRIHHNEFYINGETLSDGTTKVTLGVQNWIVDNLLLGAKKSAVLGDIIRGLQVRLGHKMAGFTTPDRLTLSAESFGLVPAEDVTISLYSSPASNDYFYSGILIENTPTGWRVVGYNPDYPFFDIILAEEASRKINISSGVAAKDRPVNPWKPFVYYKKDMLVENQGTVWKCISPHTSSTKFEPSFWEATQAVSRQLSTSVYKQTKSSGVSNQIEYGTEFQTKQDIADLIFGYERWLVSQGFVFAAADDDSSSFVTAVKNFLKWSEIEWKEGAFITLSPSARQLKFDAPTGIILDVKNAVLDRTGHYFAPKNYAVDRAGTETVLTAFTDDIYGARLTRTEIEHCLIFSNITIFGDVIFNPLYNIRQDRLQMSAKVASNWVGRYEAPGFVIEGDQIVPNFVKLGEDVREMFDIELADNTILRDHARHVIGFESRDYLDQLLMSETQQFELYQGMIQQKGSAGALTTILRSSQVEQDRQLTFLEEWAFRIGTFGAYNPSYRMEFVVEQADIHNQSQIIHFDTLGEDDWLNLTTDRWVSIPTDFTELLITDTAQSMPDAGYVRTDEVTYTVAQESDFTNLVTGGLACNAGETIWLTHGTTTWDVELLSYPTADFSSISVLQVIDSTFDPSLNVQDNRIVFSGAHSLLVNDTIYLVGGSMADLPSANTVLRVGSNWVEVDDPNFAENNDFTTDTTSIPPTPLHTISLRFADTTARDVVDFADNTLAYVDNVAGAWKVFKKILGAWTEIRRQPKKVDNTKFTSSVIYDPATVITPSSLEVEPPVYNRLSVVDPLANIIPGVADRELDFKLEYDPADYDEWGPEQVGMTWWNLDTVRFVNYYTDDADTLAHDSVRYQQELSYRNQNWSKVTSSSTVDIYEWSRSLSLPDASSGNILENFVTKIEYDSGLNKVVTVYYYWVLNPQTVPLNKGRKLSAQSVSQIIQNPSAAGLIWYAAIASTALLIVGAKSIFDDSGMILQMNFALTDYKGEEHAQWTLMRPGDSSTLPPNPLWEKLLDSLRGCDINLTQLPSSILHPTQRSGLEVLQSMFGDVALADARQSFVRMLNYILLRTQRSAVSSLPEKLTLSDAPLEYMYWTGYSGELAVLPPATEYDRIIYSYEDLADTLQLPVRVLLDNRGASVPSWSIWVTGNNGPEIMKGYDIVVNNRSDLTTVFPTMDFNERVLVLNDEQADGFWTIWEKRGDGQWDIEPFDQFIYDGDAGVTLGLMNAQKYRTADFWHVVDWYDPSIDANFPPTAIYANIGERNSAEGGNPQNTLVKVTDDDNFWSWYQYQNNEWVLVARENGTIQVDEAFFTSTDLYGILNETMNLDVTKILGRDGTFELSPLMDALKNNVLTIQEVNELWFSMIHFIHVNLDLVDWALKTSFLNILGFNERMWASPIAVIDNMPLLLQYIDEVKPYRVKVRDILQTAAPDIDVADTIVTDFDQPVYFDATLNQYRRLSPDTDSAILSSGIYQYATNFPDEVRQFAIGILFDRIWPEASGTAGAADRIMAYYQPGANMRAKSLTELLKLDFKGTIYDGSTLGDTDRDIILKGSNADGSQIDLNVSGGFQLRDPAAAANKPEELISVAGLDGLVVRANDRWGNGAPQHTVRHYDVEKFTTDTVTLDTGALADSIAVFRDGVRANPADYTFNQLANSATVNIVSAGPRTTQVAIHSFGFAANDQIRDQQYFQGGETTYNFANASTGLVEVSVNGSLLDPSVVTVDNDTVTITSQSSDVVLMTGYTTATPHPIRQNVATLAWNVNVQWQLTTLPDLFPYHASIIVEKNGLRLTPPKTYYPTNVISYFLNYSVAANISVWDDRTQTAHAVEDILTITSDVFDSDVAVRAALTGHRFVLWENSIVFCDVDAGSRSYVVAILDGEQDFTISETGVLTLAVSMTAEDILKVTNFSNDTKMDIRSHVYHGAPDGIYGLSTTRNGRAWMTINGRRLVENVDFSIIETLAEGTWDIDPFESFSYDAFRDVEIVIRFPTEVDASRVVITTFEGIENNSASSWQISTTTPDEMRLLPADNNGRIMYMVRKAWEIVSLDPIRRAGALTVDIDSETQEIVVTLNPSSVPSVMIPSQPLLIADEDTPGVIWIGAERIEYFSYARSGNTVTLSQLRRGTRGTAAAQHLTGDLALAPHELDNLPVAP